MSQAVTIPEGAARVIPLPRLWLQLLRCEPADFDLLTVPVGYVALPRELLLALRK